MDFAAQEALDGVRFAWNVWPASRLEATRNVIPLAAVVTPLKDIEGLPVLQYPPVRCKCSGVLNPFCSVDFAAKGWICPFCLARNPFPPHYSQISEAMQPAELYPQYTAIEYTLQSPVQLPSTFLLLADLCLPAEELQDLKTALKLVMSLLPENSLVGLISFGALVALHELSSELPKAYIFRGDRATTADQLAKQLGLGVSTQQRPLGGPALPPAAGRALGRFLLPLSECEFALESAIDDLQEEEDTSHPTKRPLRATGAAVGVAIGLLEKSVAGSGARAMLFTGGPATCGPGMVVGRDRGEALRSHKDFEKGSVKQFMKSVQYYDELGARLIKAGHCLDVFSCSLDQVGLAEMHPAVNTTGGAMMIAETFGHENLKKSLARLLERDANDHLQLAFNATLKILCSKEVGIQGASGPCSSLGVKGPGVSDTEQMAGGTNTWRLCSCSPRTSLGIFFEVGHTSGQHIPHGKLIHLQFATTYQHSSGQQRLRVVTTARSWADPKSEQISEGFDQEAAMVLLARMSTFRLMEQDGLDVLRWLDRSLIKLASRFAGYTQNQADTFALPPNFSLFPQFVFNFRRSPFMQVFGHSPDETAFFRLVLEREATAGAMVMIQPQLLAYGFNAPPEPVLLDVQSIQADQILLLDTFFMVIVHYGSTIVQWRKAGYQNQEEHASFRELLAAPLKEAKELLKGRFPVPKLLETDQGGSQARFLTARLNPSVTHERAGGTASEIIFTEDVALDVFLEHLARLAVVP